MLILEVFALVVLAVPVVVLAVAGVAFLRIEVVNYQRQLAA